MPRTHLPFIDDAQIEEIVRETLDVAHDAKRKSETKFARNVIDPFCAIFEMTGFGLSPGQWLAAEKTRQAQKTLSNQIGGFHQRVLGSLTGWKDLGRAGGLLDVVNVDRKIVAEIKNKHNTIKASDQKNLYRQLEDLVMPKGQEFKGFTAYYVQIIPKSSLRFDVPFTPADNQTGVKKHANELVRTIDGWSFYALATGHDNALEMLFDAIPTIAQATLSVSEISQAKRYFSSAFAPSPGKHPKK